MIVKGIKYIFSEASGSRQLDLKPHLEAVSTIGWGLNTHTRSLLPFENRRLEKVAIAKI
ncbi:hypothetical protein [Fischerella thermalis]|uniref:hypothetical protein n=1 Tax=Fischerella thermalis TaxID=372787 RepID=UPI0015E06AC8|nr:hypothetical protein [Fischerella thermalis]